MFSYRLPFTWNTTRFRSGIEDVGLISFSSQGIERKVYDHVRARGHPSQTLPFDVFILDAVVVSLLGSLCLGSSRSSSPLRRITQAHHSPLGGLRKYLREPK